MEKWKPVKDFEGLYEVSDKGRVRSVPRTIQRKGGGTMTYKGKVLKPDVTKQGYLKVYLSKNSKKKNCLVHRLVAEAFIPNPKGYEQVNHKNTDKADNAVSNLEWTTNLQNYVHAEKNGLRPANLRAKRVAQYTLDGKLVAEYESLSRCSKATGIKDSRIGDVCHGRRHTAHGYKFKFI